jgi:hypothetical protein
MKRFLSILAISLFLSVASQAQVFLVNESFGNTGVVAGQNGWLTHSGTANQINYSTTSSDLGNSLNYSGLLFSPSGNRIQIVAGNSEDINIPLSSPVTSGSVYYTALVKVINNDWSQLFKNLFLKNVGIQPNLSYLP